MRENLIMTSLSLLMTLASLAVLAWTLIIQRDSTMDALLLMTICLLVATVFGLNLLYDAFSRGYLDFLVRRSSQADDKKQTAPSGDSKPGG